MARCNRLLWFGEGFSNRLNVTRIIQQEQLQ